VGAGPRPGPPAPGRDPRHERRTAQRAGFVLQLEDLGGLPVAITHGTQDPLVDVERGRDTRDRAVAAGADVVYRESDVPHTVDPRVVPDLVGWVDARF
jgi:predicted esterase